MAEAKTAVVFRVKDYNSISNRSWNKDCNYVRLLE
jgi:hypothetical protein